MAGNELVTEGFKAGQVGSSAMPHKMNTRSCERVNGFAVILRRPPVDGPASWPATSGTRATSSCSVVRRVALPDAFFALDGLFETFLTVLDEFGAYPAVIDARAAPLPAVPRHHQGPDGRGPRRRRARDRARGDQGARGGGGARRCARRAPRRNDLFERLAADERLGLDAGAIADVVAEPLAFVGDAPRQVAAFVARVEPLVAADPSAAAYRPASIL